MRYGILSLIAALAGCAHVSHQDLETGLEVEYTGSAHGATAIIEATDPRPYDLAEDAVDKGMSTSLVRDADGDVRFSAGFGYTYGATSVGGYASGNVGYIPGQGFVTSSPISTLPPLATTVVATGVPSTQPATGGAIVPCPTDRPSLNVPEQAACAAAGVRSLTRNLVK